MKICTKCKINTTPSDLKYWCKLCSKSAIKSWTIRNRNKVNLAQKRRRKNKPELFKLVRRRSTLKQYGLTLEIFNNMLQDQENKCKICGILTPGGFSNQWAVDHCHKTGTVRGLLCNNCNKGLGHFKDNIEILKAATIYLQKFHTPLNILGV